MRAVDSVAVCAGLVTLLVQGGLARAAEAGEAPEAFARVIVAETELRAGPGISHRVIHTAQRGDTFFLQGRAGSDYWLEVVMDDGRTGYILGDTVETVAVDPAAEGAPEKPGVFAPPALEAAWGGFTMMGGVFDRDGYMEFRPQLVIGPAIAFEPYVGLALQEQARRLVYGGAGTLNLAPDWSVAPFVTIGVGGIHEAPRDEFIQTSKQSFHARAGGGILVSLRWRILFRLEAANVVLFTEDTYANVQSYFGGLGTYF
ncbi:MAG TPA: SH3 domain-containing protein [Polyangiaceae bacterium]